MIISGNIADEVPSGGDPITFYLFLIVLILSIVNMVLVSKKKKGEVGKQDIIKI